MLRLLAPLLVAVTTLGGAALHASTSEAAETLDATAAQEVQHILLGLPTQKEKTASEAFELMVTGFDLRDASFGVVPVTYGSAPTQGNCLLIESEAVVGGILNLTWQPGVGFAENLTVHLYDVAAQTYLTNRTGPGPMWIGFHGYSTAVRAILVPASMQVMVGQSVHAELYLRAPQNTAHTVTVEECEAP